MTYPQPVSWSEAAESVMPAVPMRGPSGAAWLAEVAPLGDLDTDVAALYYGLADLSDAAGYVLDVAGDLVGQARGGLGDAEYRRIIAGARVARSPTGALTPRAVRRGWRALTGAEVVRVERLPPASLSMTAQIGWIPTTVYLARAGAIVRDLVADGVEIEAILYGPGTAVYDDPGTGYATGTYAYQLRVR